MRQNFSSPEVEDSIYKWCCGWLESSPPDYSIVCFPKGLSYVYKENKNPYVAHRDLKLIDARKYANDIISLTELFLEERLLSKINKKVGLEDWYCSLWSKALRYSNLDLDGFIFSSTELLLLDTQVKTSDILRYQKIQDDVRNNLFTHNNSHVLDIDILENKIPSYIENLTLPQFL